MSIPEPQLETWSGQGSITQSASTYNAVKDVLEAAETPYADKKYRVFLHGSYGNDTNIYAESDVDIVIQCNSSFQHDLSRLSDEQQKAFHRAFSTATYTAADFKRDVIATLRARYGSDVSVGTKAIAIAAGGGRRKTDVIAAVQFRRYHKFNSLIDEKYDEGICFYDSAGNRIANFPKHHSDNLTAKHQSSSKWLKPSIRILKNLRNKLIKDGTIESGLAPSYYLEGLLYNVPDEHFCTSYGDCFVQSINWLRGTDKSKLVCANYQYWLLHGTDPLVIWREEDCERFLNAAANLWNSW